MGHKVHPNGFRLGSYRNWEANWFVADKDYTRVLHEDLAMRKFISGRLKNAGIARIETERSSNAQLAVTIYTAKPGIVIGKGGASVDALRNDLEKLFGSRVKISIQEIKQPELDAQLVAENIALQIERRISHRRAMKQAIMRTMRAGAKGVRIALGGRLRGGEMARREWDREGQVPLHTLRADIRFGRATAKTTFGVIGVKCWIYRDLLAPKRRGGELVPESLARQADAAATEVRRAAAAQAQTPGQVQSGTLQAAAVNQNPSDPQVAAANVAQQVAGEQAGAGLRQRAPRPQGTPPSQAERRSQAGTRPKTGLRPAAKPRTAETAQSPATGSAAADRGPVAEQPVPAVAEQAPGQPAKVADQLAAAPEGGAVEASPRAARTDSGVEGVAASNAGKKGAETPEQETETGGPPVVASAIEAAGSVVASALARVRPQGGAGKGEVAGAEPEAGSQAAADKQTEQDATS